MKIFLLSLFAEQFFSSETACSAKQHRRPSAGVVCRLLFLISAFCFQLFAFATPPLRIVSQTVGSDELLLALAEPGQIAALSHLARDPQFCAASREAAAYPQLPLHAGAESILKHRPSLVLFADYSRAELVAQIQRSGVEVIIFTRYNTLEDAYFNLRLLGKRLGPDAEKRAEKIIAHCQQRVAALQEKLRGTTPVRVISPSTYGIIPGDKTTFQDFCDHAGAENLAKTHGKLAGHATAPVEQMLRWPVDRVVLIGGAEVDTTQLPTPAQIEKALAPIRQVNPYRFMPAVREKRAVLLAAWQSSCVTHHRVTCYEYLARQLHPEKFKE